MVMKMKQRSEYTYQKFLVESNANDVNLEELTVDGPKGIPSYELEENIFDQNGYFRKVALSTLDLLIDTEKDFENFFKRIQCVDRLYIEDDRPQSENPIYKAFSQSQKQKLIKKFLDKNINVKLTLS